MLPAPAAREPRDAEARSRKRKQPGGADAPAPQDAEDYFGPEGQDPAAAPASDTRRFVRITNHSHSGWVLELANPFNPHRPIVWKRGSQRPLRAARPKIAEPGEIIDIMTAGREYYRVPPGRRRYILVPSGNAPLLVRLWDEVHRANPFGITLALENAKHIPTFRLADDASVSSATDGQIRKTLRFSPNKITLKTDGWDEALVAADPPGTGLEGSPSAPGRRPKKTMRKGAPVE
jgi:hypothetical protein